MAILNLFHWQSRHSKAGTTYLGRLILIVLATAALHGLVLGVPWPFEPTEDRSEPEIVESEEGSVMDVAILPRGIAPSSSEIDRVEEGIEAEPSEDEPQLSQPEPEPEPELALELELQPESEPELEPAPKPTPTSSDDLPVDPGTTQNTPTPTPQPPKTLDERLSNPNSYVHNGKADSGPIAISSDGIAWLDNLNKELRQQAAPEAVPDLNEKVWVSYPLATCQPISPFAGGGIAIAANPDGTIIKGPDVLNSTGYDILDEKAEELVRDYLANRDRVTETKAYLIQVEVIDYPTC